MTYNMTLFHTLKNLWILLFLEQKEKITVIYFYFVTYFHPITSTRQHVHVNQQITSHLYSFFVTYQRVRNFQRKNTVNSLDVLFTNVPSIECNMCRVYIPMLHPVNIHHQYQTYSFNRKTNFTKNLISPFICVNCNL